MIPERKRQWLLHEIKNSPNNNWTAQAIIAALTHEFQIPPYQANSWREGLAARGYIQLNKAGSYSLTNLGTAWANGI